MDFMFLFACFFFSDHAFTIKGTVRAVKSLKNLICFLSRGITFKFYIYKHFHQDLDQLVSV